MTCASAAARSHVQRAEHAGFGFSEVFGGGTGRAVDGVGDALESWPEDDRTIQSNVPRTLKPPADAETYRAVEGAKGELGIYLRSDGTDSPARFKIRSPCFSNLHALPEMAEGEYVPDLVATLGSLDTIMGEVDR